MKNNSSSLILPEVVDIAASSGLQHNLHNLMDTALRIVVDARSVERISTPGIQLFLSVKKAAQAAGKEFELLEPTPVVSLAIEDLGLSSEFTKEKTA